MRTNETITNKVIKLAKSEYNEEYRSVNGALKAIATLDKKGENLRAIIKALGGIATCERRKVVANRLYERTPFYTEVDGERIPVDEVKRKDKETGKMVKIYKIRTIWTPAKIINAIKWYTYENESTFIASDQLAE